MRYMTLKSIKFKRETKMNAKTTDFSKLNERGSEMKASTCWQTTIGVYDHIQCNSMQFNSIYMPLMRCSSGKWFQFYRFMFRILLHLHF